MTKNKELINHQSLFSQSLTWISKRGIFYFVAGMSLFAINACEFEFEPQIEHVVDTTVEEYYERFIYEAAVRGLDVEYATYQVDAAIGDIPEHNVIGQCSWDQNHNHAITLDRAYWNSANDMQREFVVFHELGHCVLGRDHVDDADGNGNCESIMTSGTGSCRVLYVQNNRAKLLDELFSN